VLDAVQSRHEAQDSGAGIFFFGHLVNLANEFHRHF
jgi:hypothetical protein